jgi:hypothetical protein
MRIHWTEVLNTAIAEVDNVVHPEHGLYGWYQAELPIEGE